ncbi:MAG: class I SAM-dependent methyltransferase [Myxococcaceae bacterium]
MRKVVQRLPKRAVPPPRGHLGRALAGMVLGPLNWMRARTLGTPGLGFHAKAARVGWKLLRRYPSFRLQEVYPYFFFPLDSTRYFELSALGAALAGVEVRRCLDVSSPRLFSLSLLLERPDCTVHFLNPDSRDLEETRRAAKALGCLARSDFSSARIEEFGIDAPRFDLAVCISVLEHIPNDAQALTAIWKLVAPGGRLLLSVPCAAEEKALYLEENLYGVLPAEPDGTVFFEYLYDEQALAERVFAITGPPSRMEIWGERCAGFLQNNREGKWGDSTYPFWREASVMGEEMRRFRSVSDLPGEGVVTMEFVRS